MADLREAVFYLIGAHPVDGFIKFLDLPRYL